MASIGEVKSTVNSLEVSPSKSSSPSKIPKNQTSAGGGGKGGGFKKK